MTKILARVGLAIALLLTVISSAADLPVVNVVAAKGVVTEALNGYSSPGEFDLVSDQPGPLDVKFEMLGSAVLGTNYVILTNTANGYTNFVGTNFVAHIRSGTNGTPVRFAVLDDHRYTPDKTIIMRLVPDPTYTIGDLPFAGVVLKTLPPPTVSISTPGVTNSLVPAGAPLALQGTFTGPVDSIQLQVDGASIGSVTKSGGSFSGQWSSPTPGDHMISAVTTNSFGDTATATIAFRVVSALAIPRVLGVTDTYTTATRINPPFTQFTPQGILSGFAEIRIPDSATNLIALLFVTASASAAPVQIFGYNADGLLDTNDLAGPFELLAILNPLPSETELQVDITPLARRNAGQLIGINFTVDPSARPINNLPPATYFYNPQVVFFEEGRDPTRAQILRPQSGAAIAADSVQLAVETFDLDSRVDVIHVEGHSTTNHVVFEKTGLDLGFGTNVVALNLTNITPGIWSFTVTASAVGQTASTSMVNNIYVYPADHAGPDHRWLGTDGGGYSLSVVLPSGEAFVWGRNNSNQLGLGSTVVAVRFPVSLPAPLGKRWRQITQSMWRSLELTDDGQVYTTGPWWWFATPTLVSPDLRGIARIAINETNGYALDAWGTLYEFNDTKSPTIIARDVRDVDAGGTRVGWISAGEPWTAISVASQHSLFLDGDGQMYASGWNTQGQYPMAGPAYSATPIKAPLPDGVTRWTKIAAGDQVNLAVDDRGRLFSWGLQGSTGSATWALNTPNLVDVPETGWLDISVGKIFALALSASGKLYYWGLIPGSELQPTNVPTLAKGLPNLLSPNLTGTLLALDRATIGSDGSLGFDVLGPTGATFKVQSSQDFIHWKTLVTGTTVNGVVHFNSLPKAEGKAFLRITSVDTPDNP